MVDILGYKQSALSAMQMIKKVKSIRAAISAHDEFMQSRWKSTDREYFPCTTSFMSDTFVLAVPVQAGVEGSDAFAIVSLAQRLTALHAQARTTPSIMVRGCITVGDFWMDDNLLAGEGVFCAASNMECSQGALIWLDRTAFDLINEDLARKDPIWKGYVDDNEHEQLIGALLPRTTVKLKGDREIWTRIVSPFPHSNDEYAHGVLECYDEALSNSASLDVWSKHRTTGQSLTIAMKESTDARAYMWDQREKYGRPADKFMTERGLLIDEPPSK
jgi:hypothetical protein